MSPRSEVILRFLRAALVGGVLAATAWATLADAQQNAPVQLRSIDGTISVSGNLVAIENGVYVIDVKGLGILRVDAGKVECTGVVCPAAATEQGPNFGIYGSRTVGTVLIPSLLEGYAKHVGAAYEIARAADPA